MERYKYFKGQRSTLCHQVDATMDALNRNNLKLYDFLTAHYGINMQESEDAMKIIASSGTYTFNIGKAISPQFNLIINDAIYDFTEELIITTGPYDGNPQDGDKVNIYVLPKENYDSNTLVEIINDLGITDPYEKWNINFELEILEKDITPSNADNILLAELTYDSSTERWNVSQDYRWLSEFSLSIGTLSFASHILSAHTAGLCPYGTTALKATKKSNMELSFEELQSEREDYIYSEGKIYSVIESYSYDFSPENTGNWYYVYIKNQDLEVIAAGDSTPPGLPLSLSDIGLDDEKYLVLCYVWYNSNKILSEPIDLRQDYFLLTRADQIRIFPDILVSSKDLQSALDTLAVEKIERDGSIPMEGDFNFDFHNIEKLQDLNLKLNTGEEHILQSDSKPVYINATDDLTKGARVNATGEVYIKGEVQADINMVEEATVDGKDISKIGGECLYLIVDRDGDGGPGATGHGTVGLEYALGECAEHVGITVYIKNPPNGYYTLANTYTLKLNTTIIGESFYKTYIKLNGFSLHFGDHFRIKGLKLLLDTTAGDTLTFPDNGKVEDCYLNKVIDSDINVYCGKSTFKNIYADSLEEAIDGEMNGSNIVGCTLREISARDNTKGLNTTFWRVFIYGDDTEFTNCISAFFADTATYGWQIKDKDLNGESRSYQFTHLAGCTGDIIVLGNHANLEDHAHAMVSCHKGNCSHYPDVSPSIVLCTASYRYHADTWQTWPEWSPP